MLKADECIDAIRANLDAGELADAADKPVSSVSSLVPVDTDEDSTYKLTVVYADGIEWHMTTGDYELVKPYVDVQVDTILGSKKISSVTLEIS